MSCDHQHEQWQTDYDRFVVTVEATKQAESDLQVAQATEQQALAAAAQATTAREAAEQTLEVRTAEQNGANTKMLQSFTAWSDCMQIDQADAARAFKRA